MKSYLFIDSILFLCFCFLEIMLILHKKSIHQCNFKSSNSAYLFVKNHLDHVK